MAAPAPDVRALRRGLQVIEQIAQQGAASLADLHRGTGLAKSTIRRLLTTLEDANFIRCSLADGLFRSNINLPSQSQSQAQTRDNLEHARIASAAGPVLKDMAHNSVWPSELFVRAGQMLMILDTNRALTPIVVNRTLIGDQVDMVTTAVGRVYLAFCPAAEREEILTGFERTSGVRAVAPLRAAVKETAELGYGVRDPSCSGATLRDPLLMDRLKAVAVPVMADGRVICCINMLWPLEASSVVAAEAETASRLREYADAIADNYLRAKKKSGAATLALPPINAATNPVRRTKPQPGLRPSKAAARTPAISSRVKGRGFQ